jgi:hypothetical protein
VVNNYVFRKSEEFSLSRRAFSDLDRSLDSLNLEPKVSKARPSAPRSPETERLQQLGRFEIWLETPSVSDLLKAAIQRWEERRQEQPKERRGAGPKPDKFWKIGAALLLSAYTTPPDAPPETPLKWRDDPSLDPSERKKRQRLAKKWQGHLCWEELWPELQPLLQAFEEKHLSVPAPVPSVFTLSEDWRDEVRALVTSALQDVLENPQIGPQVLKIPPGMGKTTELARAICDRTRLPLKVLWFLRESRQRGGAGGGTSPVKEILDLFPEAQASAKVIEGGQPRADRAAYIQKQGWIPDHPGLQVRLLAHAYLPWLFGKGDIISWAPFLTQDADLIVIDEDPLGTLVTTQDDLPAPLAWSSLLKLMQDSGLLRDGDPLIPLPTPKSKRGVPTQLSSKNSLQDLLPGESRVQPDDDHQRWITAWAKSLNPDPPSDSWTKFKDELARHLSAAALNANGRSALPVYQQVHTRSLIRRIATELQQELETVHKTKQGTRRFGLIWTPGPAQEELVHLRFSLPRELQFRREQRGGQEMRPIPVLILDAYAHEERYRQVLNAATRSALPGSRFRLDVQTYTSAGQLNPLTLKKGAGRRHLVRLILETVLSGLDDDGTLDQSVLLLAPGAVTGTLKQPKEKGTPQESKTLQAARMQAIKVVLPWLAEVFPPRSGKEVRFHPQHWFAGRGVNQFTGWDVVALTRPRTPLAAQDRLMAHLPEATPKMEKERAHLQWYDEDVELLQMLNRGRQLRYRDDAGKAPRVITMFPLNAPDELHPLLQGNVHVLPQRAVSRRSGGRFQHRQLAGLTIPRGKLELTKLITLGVVMELLHRPPVAGLPPRWFPEEVLVVLGLLSPLNPGPAVPSAVTEAFLSALKLEEADPAYRFTASARRHSAAGTGLWSPMLGDKVPWVAPGSAAHLVSKLKSALEGPLKVCLHHFPVKNVGLVWSLDELNGPAIHAWSRSVQDRLGLENTE